ncbi:MAG: hypothetical protein ABL858_03425 [Candidatus Nitrotoga sp.]
MADLIELVGLKPLLAQHGIESEEHDFEAVFDGAVRSANTELVGELERRVHHYFSQLVLPETATAYDYLLLSLRPKDLIATFNWDPLLAQAFRRHEGKIALPQLAFLHGNVAYGYCAEHRRCGWIDDRCTSCRKPFELAPLLYLIRDKNYTENPFILSQWALLEHNMRSAYFLTIFGYSAPETDAAARSVMMEAWGHNENRTIAEIDLIDIKPQEELHANWKDFITRTHYGTADSIKKSYVARHPRRSCDALAAATVMQQPWEDNWLPETMSFDDLRAWVNPLWEEERRLAGTGQQFSGRLCSKRSRDEMK